MTADSDGLRGGHPRHAHATQLIDVALANWRPYEPLSLTGGTDMTDDAVLDETRQPARRKLLQVLGPGDHRGVG